MRKMREWGGRGLLEREGGRSGGMGGKREEIVKEVEGYSLREEEGSMRELMGEGRRLEREREKGGERKTKKERKREKERCSLEEGIVSESME